MNPLIQITGLPRSGTAFVSTFLNLNPDCIAFHELAALDNGWRETIADARMDHPFVADVSTYGFLPGVVDPESIKVFIDIPWRESLESAKKVLDIKIDQGAYRELYEMARKWVLENEPLIISVDNLWTIESMQAIWLHCFGFDGMPFPKQKSELMIGMNIQRNNPKELFGHDCFEGRHEEFA